MPGRIGTRFAFVHGPRKCRKDETFGIGRLRERLNNLGPDILFIVHDLSIVAQGLRAPGGRPPVPTVVHAPVDGVRIAQVWWSGPCAAHRVAAMAGHGQRVLRDETGIDAAVFPRGIENDRLHPARPERPLVVEQGGQPHRIGSREEARSPLGPEGRFQVLGPDRNAVRTNSPDIYRLLDRFRGAHRDAVLDLHAAQKDGVGELSLLAERYGMMRDTGWVRHPGDTFLGSDKSTLAWLYNAADGTLATAVAEGFGLTDAEALAAPLPWWRRTSAHDGRRRSRRDPGTRSAPCHERQDRGSALADLGAMHAALELLHADRRLRASLSERAVGHARRDDRHCTADAFFGDLEGLVRLG